MTGSELIRATIRGEARERFAFMPISMTLAADEVGAKYRDYANDYRIQAEGQLAFAEAFGADHVSAISDPAVEATDLGAEVIAPEDQPAAPDGERALLADKSKLGSLRAPDPGSGRRMSNRLEAVRLLAERAGNELLVEGWVEGPCAEAADLRGLSRLMMDFYDDPPFVRELVAFVEAMETGFARAQAAAGAGIVGVGDAASSLIGPDLFGEFMLDCHRRYVEAIHSAGALARLHVCGNSSGLVRLTKGLGYDIVDLDYPVDLAAARAEAGPRQVFSGNIDPVRVLRDGDERSVTEALEACRAAVGGAWIVGAGCEIPRGAPRENTLAMRDFARGRPVPAP
jgi:MtaA/CmuA family methyltransferase